MQVEKNPLSAKITQIVESATHRLVVSAATLAGGRTDAKLVVLSDGSQVVVKLPKGNGDKLAIEGATAGRKAGSRGDGGHFRRHASGGADSQYQKSGIGLPNGG